MGECVGCLSLIIREWFVVEMPVIHVLQIIFATIVLDRITYRLILAREILRLDPWGAPTSREGPDEVAYKRGGEPEFPPCVSTPFTLNVCANPITGI